MMCLLMRMVAEDINTHARHAATTAAACLAAVNCASSCCCCSCLTRGAAAKRGNGWTTAKSSSELSSSSLYCILSIPEPLLDELTRIGVPGCSASKSDAQLRKVLFKGNCAHLKAVESSRCGQCCTCSCFLSVAMSLGCSYCSHELRTDSGLLQKRYKTTRICDGSSAA